ncbi:hypothetical protein ACLI4Z_14820 [Natrialbaceae archaeon A-arb3/5]
MGNGSSVGDRSVGRTGQILLGLVIVILIASRLRNSPIELWLVIFGFIAVTGAAAAIGARALSDE